MTIVKTILVVSVLSLMLSACNKQVDKSTAEETRMQTNTKTTVDTAAQLNSITIKNAFAKPSLPGQKMGAAFFTFHNTSDKDVKVTEISSDVSDVTELHSMEMKNGKMIMRKMDELVIPAKGNFVLSPGGNHVMFIDLKNPLNVDDEVTINLSFDNGQQLEVMAKVKESAIDEHAEHDHTEHNHAEHQHAEHDHTEHNHAEHNHTEHDHAESHAEHHHE